MALLLVGACNNDPTADMRNGVVRVQAEPSTLNVTHGNTKKTQVTAVDDQGNPIESAYEVTAVGPGISVTRDSTFVPIFIGNTLTVPPTAPTFQFIVTGNDLVSSSFTVSAQGHDVTIPVIVLPDPVFDTVKTAVAATGAAPTDTITATIPAPYLFQTSAAIVYGGSTVVSGDGSAVVTQRAADGTSVKLLALPGSTGNGSVSGAAINYAATIPLTNAVITDPITVDATNPPALAGTDNATTAPVIDLSTGVGGVLDGKSFAAADCGQNTGVPCQLYRFSLPEDTDVHVRLQWPNDADVGLYFINAADGTDSDQICDDNGRASGVAEECDLSFPAGDYIAAVVNFGPFYPLPGADPGTPEAGGPDPDPDWVALQIAIP